MPKHVTPIQRRLAPCVLVALEFEDGQKLEYKLAFDMNVLALIVEKTDLNLLDTREMWVKLDARVLGAMFWAAATVHQPELANDEGLVAMRSLLVGDNVDRAADALWDAYLLFLPPRQREAMRKMREKKAEEQNPPQPDVPTETAAPADSTPSANSCASGPSPATISASATASSAS